MTEEQIIEHGGSLSPSLCLAMRAAAAAGQIVEAGYGKLNEIALKDVGDLVSKVDLDADAAACDVIRSASDLPILSEELHSATPDSDAMWIIDPLDGSSAFLLAAGKQYPAVLVAAREKQETILGVCYFPLTDEWFYACRGRGAWRNGKRLICNQVEEPLSQVWVEMNRYGNAEWETGFFSCMQQRLRSEGGAQLVTSNVPYSGVAMRIAMGDSSLGAAIHDNNRQSVKQGPWDIAAPQLILEEAGGAFLNPAGKRTDPFVAQPIIVARSVELARDILQLVVPQSANH